MTRTFSSPEDYEIDTVGHVSVFRLHEPRLMEFDSIPTMQALIEDFLRDAGTTTTLVDFGQIPFSSSLALAFLASLPKKAERHGRTIALCNLNPQSMWAVQATRLHEILDIHYDEEQALARL